MMADPGIYFGADKVRSSIESWVWNPDRGLEARENRRRSPISTSGRRLETCTISSGIIIFSASSIQYCSIQVRDMGNFIYLGYIEYRGIHKTSNLACVEFKVILIVVKTSLKKYFLSRAIPKWNLKFSEDWERYIGGHACENRYYIYRGGGGELRR